MRTTDRYKWTERTGTRRSPGRFRPCRSRRSRRESRTDPQSCSPARTCCSSLDCTSAKSSNGNEFSDSGPCRCLSNPAERTTRCASYLVLQCRDASGAVVPRSPHSATTGVVQVPNRTRYRVKSHFEIPDVEGRPRLQVVGRHELGVVCAGRRGREVGPSSGDGVSEWVVLEIRQGDVQTPL